MVPKKVKDYEDKLSEVLTLELMSIKHSVKECPFNEEGVLWKFSVQR